MSLQDDINDLLTDAIHMSASTQELLTNLDQIIDTPSGLNQMEKTMLLDSIKKKILSLQTAVNESTDLIAHAAGVIMLDHPELQ